MVRSVRLQMVAVLAAGALLGYGAASGHLNPFQQAGAAGQPAQLGNGADQACCTEGVSKGQLLALEAHNEKVEAKAAQAGKKPNILVIMGDDIGIPQISAYTMGLMGYRTPNIDRIAKEGALFTDSYGQQSCTAGRASFILGQEPFRTGPLTLGMPRRPPGHTG